MGCGSSALAANEPRALRVRAGAEEVREVYAEGDADAGMTPESKSVVSEVVSEPPAAPEPPAPPSPQFGLPLFFQPQDSESLVAVEVSPTSTVGDLEAAVKWALGRSRLPWLTYQGTSLKDEAEPLADLGVSPESVVSEEVNHEELLERLCGWKFPGADPAKPAKVLGADGHTLVHALAQAGEDAALKALVVVLRRLYTPGAVSEELNKARRSDGKTPCILAAEEGHGAVVKMLLEAGAEVNRAAGEGEETQLSVTPCYVAAERGHTAVLNILIDAGAEVNKAALDKHGVETTPCFAASNNGHVGSLTVLIDAGADVNRYGKYVSRSSKRYAWESMTPCHAAARRGRGRILQVLIAAGADVNRAGKDLGWTPCLAAVCSNRSDLVSLLIRAGADLEIVSRDHQTPLRMAAGLGLDAMLDTLIEAGADVNSYAALSHAPIVAAHKGGHHTSVIILRRAGADLEPLEIAKAIEKLKGDIEQHERNLKRLDESEKILRDGLKMVDVIRKNL